MVAELFLELFLDSLYGSEERATFGHFGCIISCFYLCSDMMVVFLPCFMIGKVNL